MSEVTESAVSSEEAPKPRRTRKPATTRSAKKTATSDEGSSEKSAPIADNVQSGGEGAGNQEPPAKKPRAKTTRTRKTKTEAQPVEGSPAVEAAASEVDAQAAAVTKPRRRTKKAQEEAAANDAQEGKPSADEAASAVVERHMASAPQRALTEEEAAALIAQARAAAKAARDEQASETAAAPAEALETAELPGTTPLYPRRHRTRPTDTASEAEGTDETQSRARRRPRRSVKAESGALAPAPDEATPQEDAQPAPDSTSAEPASEASADASATEDRAQRTQREGRPDQREQSESKGAAARNAKDKRVQNKQNDRNNRNNRNDRANRRQRNREVEPSVTREELAELKVADLRARAEELEIDVSGLKKAELVDAVYDATVKAEGFMEVSGVLDILSEGYGFIRTQGYLPGEGDCYVGLSLIKRNGLRKGDFLVGQTRPARANEKYAAIHRVISVNDVPLEELGRRVRFADLTPVYPQERLRMEHGKNTVTARVIDLVAPIGKGQRGLIVSPPKAGKTTILKDIAASISANNPEVHLMCLLIDERPEEVTDMQRSIKGEVISSTFDMPADNHIACAEMVIERAKRLVENGRDVVILLDSITRLARAYNLAQPASGRVLSGGVDSTALYPPKKFLGAARNIENGGSLTILASALIDTGSKMDEVIFEEFKGTGNMELKLDRSLADRRIFPAIDAVASGTRKEELLLDAQVAPLIWAVRRILANMNNTERATDTLIKSIKQTETNQEFLLRMARKAQHSSKDDALEL